MSTLGTAAAVAGLGALGSLMRFGLGLALGRLTVTGSVWPTFVVNLLGSLAMGLVIGAWGSISPRSVAVTVGLLGGFTTYSAFAYGTVALLEQRAYLSAAAYVLATVLGCALACAAGLALVRALR